MNEREGLIGKGNTRRQDREVRNCGPCIHVWKLHNLNIECVRGTGGKDGVRLTVEGLKCK